MARIGKNPNKIHHLPDHAQITAAVVTHIPDLSGYFRGKLDILKLSLESMRRNADLPFDLLVFDNASCREVTDYLLAEKERGHIRYAFISARNVGLAGAYRFIAGSAPGEIVAFANDDVYYYPGWLSPQVQVLEQFPDAGVISGFYLRGTHPRAAELAREKGLEVGLRPVDDTWVAEFCRDTSYPSVEAYYKAQIPQGWTDLEDRIVTSGSISAYLGGVCWQGLFWRDRLAEMLPTINPSEAGFRSYDGYFHWRILEQGYLRLSTTERYVRHIGNVITPEIRDLARSHGLNATLTPPPPAKSGSDQKPMLPRKGILSVKSLVTRLASSIGTGKMRGRPGR